VLATSRRPLQVPGEQLVPLNGIAFPHSMNTDAAELGRYSAVQLFVQSARRVRPEFMLTAENTIAVAMICRLVQGMPLGILLAASWVAILTPEEIAAQLSDSQAETPGESLDFFESQWRAVPDRQQSLRAIFDHSWRLLGEYEQSLFAQLAVFRGGFTYEAAKSVAAATLRDLLALVQQSLLRRTESGRFELHELVRQFAAEKLQAAQAVQARNRHSAYYARRVANHTLQLEGEYQPSFLAQIDDELENVNTAWRWAVSCGRVEELAQMYQGLGTYYLMHSRKREGNDLFRPAAEALKRTLARSSEAEPEALHLLARVLWWQGRFVAGLEEWTEAEQLLRESGSWLEKLAATGRETRLDQAKVLWELGRVVAIADGEGALELYRKSLALYQQLNDRQSMARVLALWADVVWNQGQADEAEGLLKRCLSIQQEIGDRTGAAWTLDLLGVVMLYQARIEDAERFQRESLSIFQAAEYPDGISHELAMLGTTLLWAGKFTEARALLEERQRLYLTMEKRGELAFTYDALAAACLHAGDYQAARQHAVRSVATARQAGNQRQLTLSLATLGQVLLVEGAIAEAVATLKQSIATVQEIGQPEMLGCPLAYLGYALWKQEEAEPARASLAAALQNALEKKAIFTLLVSIPIIALIFAEGGKAVRALELYALAVCRPYVSYSRWFDDLIGCRIAALAATLPPAEVAASQERGRNLEIWQSANVILTELNQD
jgi:predicted ATPase